MSISKTVKALKTGEMVRFRTRHYVVEDLDVYQECEDRTVAKLAYLDDDAQGEPDQHARKMLHCGSQTGLNYLSKSY